MRIFLFLLLASANLFGQNSSGEKMNIIKTNVSAFAFRNINLTYERIINQKFSVAVGFGTLTKGNIPFAKSYLKDTEFSDMEVGMSNFTIEPRIYLGKGFGKGFYLAPYYRHSSVKADHVTLQGNYDNEDVTVNISGKASANSGGLLMGVQWFLGRNENWVLDLWIVGAHYGGATGSFRGTTSRPLTQEQQDQLKQQIDEIEVPLVKYKTTTDANGVTIALNGPWTGVRSGISVGYRF